VVMIGRDLASAPAEPGEPPWRPWQVARFSIGYASHALAGFFFVLLMFPLSIALAILPNHRYRLVREVVNRYLALLFHHWLPLLGVYRIDEISGLERAQGAAPAVFVANHRGRLDGPILLSHLKNCGTILKSRYVRRGHLALLTRIFDFIPVDMGSLEAVNAMIAECRKLIDRGTNLLIFPEGVRSQSGRLLPFKDFAFRLAIEQGRPVVPTILHYSAPFATKDLATHYPRERIRLRCRFLQPLYREEGETAGQMAVRAHRLMAQELETLDRQTPWAALQGFKR
jgi:1-acyl-sn-glycerol-3-phosphate acyltransferase